MCYVVILVTPYYIMLVNVKKIDSACKKTEIEKSRSFKSIKHMHI